MAPAAIAGGFYFLLMFGCGFVLGPIREFVLGPRLGDFGATAVEALPLLAAMAWLAPRIARGMDLPARSRARAAMGLVGLVLLLAAELALSSAMRGIGPTAWASRLAATPGLLYAALLLAFAAMPWLRR